jgi:hypothetical protein
MKLPKIEKQINKKSNRVKSVLAFMGLGSAALATSYGWQAFAGIGFIIPVAMDAYTMNKLLNEKKGFKTNLLFYEPIFKRSMKKWIQKYVNEPDNIIEKKYRVLFMKLWLSHKRLDLDNISDQFFEHFEDISSELTKKGLCKYPLDMLFNKYTESKSEEYFGEKINANFFINEDQNDPEKIAIAKKIYEEYAEIGLAGRQFLNNNACDGLLMLQDYKFTSADYSLIENYTKQPKGDFGLLSDIIMVVDEIEKVLPKIIEAENEPSKLQILHNYCNYVLTNKEFIDDSTMKLMEATIKSKIDYIELKSEIDIQDDLSVNEPVKIKRAKI